MISRIDIEDMTDAQDKARVTVKPLVWHDCADGTSHDDDCLYEIEQDGRFWRLIRAVTGGGSYVGHHISREAAKAAANKYHDGWINYWIADLARPSQAGDERVARPDAVNLLATAQGIVAAMRAEQAPGPVFKALNEVIGVLEELRRAALAAMDTPKGGGQ